MLGPARDIEALGVVLDRSDGRRGVWVGGSRRVRLGVEVGSEKENAPADIGVGAGRFDVDG